MGALQSSVTVTLKELYGDELRSVSPPTLRSLQDRYGSVATRHVCVKAGMRLEVVVEIKSSCQLGRADGLRMSISVGHLDPEDLSNTQFWFFDASSFGRTHTFTFMPIWSDQDSLPELKRLTMPLPVPNEAEDARAALDQSRQTVYIARKGAVMITFERIRLTGPLNGQQHLKSSMSFRPTRAATPRIIHTSEVQVLGPILVFDVRTSASSENALSVASSPVLSIADAGANEINSNKPVEERLTTSADWPTDATGNGVISTVEVTSAAAESKLLSTEGRQRSAPLPLKRRATNDGQPYLPTTEQSPISKVSKKPRTCNVFTPVRNVFPSYGSETLETPTTPQTPSTFPGGLSKLLNSSAESPNIPGLDTVPPSNSTGCVPGTNSIVAHMPASGTTGTSEAEPTPFDYEYPVKPSNPYSEYPYDDSEDDSEHDLGIHRRPRNHGQPTYGYDIVKPKLHKGTTASGLRYESSECSDGADGANGNDDDTASTISSRAAGRSHFGGAIFEDCIARALKGYGVADEGDVQDIKDLLKSMELEYKIVLLERKELQLNREDVKLQRKQVQLKLGMARMSRKMRLKEQQDDYKKNIEAEENMEWSRVVTLDEYEKEMEAEETEAWLQETSLDTAV